MQLSIIIVNYNVYDDIVVCINSIVKYLKDISCEIIVIDNNSSDRKIDNITVEFPSVKYIPLDSNYGFGAANNAGMQVAKGDFLFLVNPDIVFIDDSIKTLYNFLSNNQSVGVVGPVQEKPGKGIEYYYTFFPSIYSRLMQEFRLYMTAPIMKSRFYNFLNDSIDKKEPFKVDWVIGSCMMLKAEIYKQTGGFDEAFFLYEEETEWQYRMSKLGWNTYMHPKTKVLHNHHSSASKLGQVFIHYQEFRSRIIFDSKRFTGIKYFLRYLLINLALCLRIIYFMPKSLFSKSSLVKLKANFDLLLFNNKSLKSKLNDRYNHILKSKLFNS